MKTSKPIIIFGILALALLSIAGTKLSQLPRTTTLGSNDLIMFVRTTDGRKTNFAQEMRFFGTNISQWITNAGSGGSGDVSTAQLNAASNAAISSVAGTLKSYATNINTLPSIYTNVLYVNATGSTAVINGQLLTNAILSAPRLTKVHASFGRYIIQTNLSSLLRDQVHLYFEPGSIIDVGLAANADGFQHLFHDFNGAVTSSITGGGIFTVSNDVESYVMWLSNSASKVKFEFEKARAATQYAAIKHNGGELIMKFTDGIYADGYDAYINEDTNSITKLYVYGPNVIGHTDAGDSSFEFAGGFANPGDCEIRVAKARGDLTIPDNADIQINSVDLATSCVIYSPLFGVGNGILRNAYVFGTSNRTHSLISLPSNDGGFRTAGVFENCRFIGGTNRTIATISNSPTSSITFIDCRFEDGFGATNSIRGYNSQSVKISNTKMDLGLHANVTQSAVTNYHGTIQSSKVLSSGAITAGGVLTAQIGIDNNSDYNQTAGNYTLGAAVTADIQGPAFFSSDVNLPLLTPASILNIDGAGVVASTTIGSDLAFDGTTLNISATPTVAALTVTNTTSGSLFTGSGFTRTNGFNRSALHGWNSTNLQWRLVKMGTLTNVVDVSAAAYYPSNNTFFTVHNNNSGRITEWTLDGVFLRNIDGSGSGLVDVEGIVYMGGNKFAVVEEDLNNIYVISITNNAAGSTWTTNNSEMFELPTSIGVDGSGSGVEGIAYDWDRQLWWIAKEKAPAQLLIVTNQPGTANWFTNNWFTTAQMQTFTNANITDFSDLFLDRENQILWAAQDEGGQFDRVIGISLLTSNIVSIINATNFGQLEGVSITPDGRAILTGEANQFAIYEPVMGGLNSGQSWNNFIRSTNTPALPSFNYGLSVGPFGVYLTNWFATNITLDFPVIEAQSETNLQFSLAWAANDYEVTVTPPAYTAGVIYSGQPSNGVVYVRGHNYSTTTKDPASGGFRVVVKGWR